MDILLKLHRTLVEADEGDAFTPLFVVFIQRELETKT